MKGEEEVCYPYIERDPVPPVRYLLQPSLFTQLWFTRVHKSVVIRVICSAIPAIFPVKILPVLLSLEVNLEIKFCAPLTSLIGSSC